MNKILSSIIIVIALGLIAYNCTLVNAKAPFVDDSLVALIGVFASLCAIILILIYNTSKKIQNEVEDE